MDLQLCNTSHRTMVHLYAAFQLSARLQTMFQAAHACVSASGCVEQHRTSQRCSRAGPEAVGNELVMLTPWTIPLSLLCLAPLAVALLFALVQAEKIPALARIMEMLTWSVVPLLKRMSYLVRPGWPPSAYAVLLVLSVAAAELLTGTTFTPRAGAFLR